MNLKIIEAAKAVALSSPGVGRNRNYKVGAVLFRRGIIVNARHNCYKTHPALQGYTEHPFLHAESHVLVAHGLDNCDGLEMLVVRIKQPDNQLTMARPCRVCQKLLSKVGLRKIHYSNWEGEIDVLC